MIVVLLLAIVAFVLAIASYHLRAGGKTLVARYTSRSVSKAVTADYRPVSGAKPATGFGRYFRRLR
jgi:hypothetical protein